VSVEKSDLPGESLGQRDIVSILTCDVLSLGESQGMIKRRRDSLIGLLEKDDPAVRIASNDLGRSVSRSIIYDDEFKITEGLG
jgi:hypothetical protein